MHPSPIDSRTIIALLALALLPASPARADTEQDWFDRAVAESTDRVNEGRLVFLDSAPKKPAHFQQNHVVIAEHSLDDGWVDLHQCHDSLDAVPRSQIVFHKERSRALRVTRAEGVGRIWVEGHTVQLENTGHDARVCLSVETQALERGAGGEFSLRNGPYMRRFLDGYYPMHVATRITMATPRLDYASMTPLAQPGLRIWQEGRDVLFDALFEGRLVTRMLFRSVD